MARRNDDRDSPGAPFNAPFRGLEKLVGPRPAAPPPKAPPRAAPLPRRSTAPPARPAQPSADDGELFQSAVRGVVPIPSEERDRAAGPGPSPGPVTILSDEDAVLAELGDLVAGVAAFDVSDTEEHVEGMVVGLDPRLLRRLRAGEFAYQAHIDLHGMKADEAQAAVRDFVVRSMVAGHRCVLVVHGRGRNSPDQRPVLKDRLRQWLTQGELGRRVLAFSSARSYDGGSGAMYVLLRRERRSKRRFHTFEGAKS